MAKPVIGGTNTDLTTPVRVVIKLTTKPEIGEGRSVRYSKAVGQTLAGLKVEPYFEAELGVRGVRSAPFDRYVAVEVSDRDAGRELVRKLKATEEVETAYVEAGPVPPPVSPDDDPRSGNQGYLTAAPNGIDARWAWTLTDGTGIRFVDLEQGWTLDHEDLVGAGISLISGVSHDYHSHGTAVLGEVLAVDNAIGGVGIAPRAIGRVVSQWRTSSNHNTAAAILSAVQAMSAGDVLLLEAQTNYGTFALVPVEVEVAVFDAIRHAVDLGIVVVEAAGNGSVDLDTFVNDDNEHVLDRNSADFRDSGAILIGAASAAVPHTRLSFSNFGSRIDCYGWGHNIDTAGGSGGAGTTAYTTSFNGTSGASPIVAGAAVLLQSWRHQQMGRVFTPEDLRNLLSSTTGNTASANPATDCIGVMPNLRAIIESQPRIRFDFPEYASFVYILFGLIDDSPGVIWVPGKGPVPVDPGWGRRAKTIPGHKRDLLGALAVSEIARVIEDETARAAISTAAVDAMRIAIDKVERLG